MNELKYVFPPLDRLLFLSAKPGNPYWKGMLRTVVDLLVLGFFWSAAKFFRSVACDIENIIYSFTKINCSNEELNCTEPFPAVSVLWTNYGLSYKGGFVEHLSL
jgi:hypothetical protein